MTPFVWQDRLVKLEDGCLMFSRKGKHDDFDFCPPESDDDMALAMSLQGGIYDARPGPNGTLLMDALGGEYALSSDRWKTCFVQAVDPLQRERGSFMKKSRKKNIYERLGERAQEIALRRAIEDLKDLLRFRELLKDKTARIKFDTPFQ